MGDWVAVVKRTLSWTTPSTSETTRLPALVKKLQESVAKGHESHPLPFPPARPERIPETINSQPPMIRVHVTCRRSVNYRGRTKGAKVNRKNARCKEYQGLEASCVEVSRSLIPSRLSSAMAMSGFWAVPVVTKKVYARRLLSITKRRLTVEPG